ncbi:hypothetical protein BDW68DRAFT_149547 [Aspergillus falconensis]
MASMYRGAPDSCDGFSRILHLAERKPGLHPSWWSQEKVAGCLEAGLRGGWNSFACAV